jgi:hypothetical protein
MMIDGVERGCLPDRRAEVSAIVTLASASLRMIAKAHRTMPCPESDELRAGFVIATLGDSSVVEQARAELSKLDTR